MACKHRNGKRAGHPSTNTYVYDTLNRLSTLTNSATGQFGFGYDELGRRTSLTRPNGVNTSYTYDSLSRLLSVLHKAGAVSLDGATYTYDNAGNRLSRLNQLNGVTENYTYDPLYQLKQVQQITGPNPGITESYTYDAVGNRLSSLNVASYSVNNSNELTSSSDGTSYTYDNNGNTLTKTAGANATGYAWDFENRLTQVTLPQSGGIVSFKYDPFGRRIQKSSSSGVTNYLYDSENSIEELDGNGVVQGAYTEGAGIDEPLAALRGSTPYYYNADAVGSITSFNSPTGASAGSYVYESFGKISASTGTLNSPLRYTGREWDQETGLYYYRARYYDATKGRFLSEDPINLRGDKNAYRYVLNSPTVLRDPGGKQGEGPEDEAVEEELLEREREERALEPIVPEPSPTVPGWEKTLENLPPKEREALEKGACPLDPKVDDALKLEQYWKDLTKRAPVRSSPYDIIPKYDADGNIRGWTTYDEFGNRAYQYEIQSSRHDSGYHSYDNTTSAGSGNGPRSPHIPF